MACRGAVLFVLWLTLGADHVGDITMGNTLAGLVVATAAALVSVALLPPAAARLRPLEALRFLWRAMRGSIVAGVDVARRTVVTPVALHPGYVRRHTRLPAGTRRDAFVAVTALLPGTLPVHEGVGGDEGDGRWIEYHCLDVTADATGAAAALAAIDADERAFMATWSDGPAPMHDGMHP